MIILYGGGTTMIIIDLRYVKSIPDMVAQLSPIFLLKDHTRESVIINLKANMLFPEYLTMIVSAFSWAKEHNIKLSITDIQRNADNTYPERINFYKLINFEVKLPLFHRFSSKGRFIEISPLEFDADKSISPAVVDGIIDIFRNNYKVSESIYKSLNYCLWEQIDNIQTHSGNYGVGYVVAQNYPTNHEIRICVVDTGMGVYKSLTETSNSSFSQLSYKQAIQKCIEEKVTRGTGMGNGLYHSSRFAIKNKGYFIIYSGNYYVEVKDGNILEVKRGAKWQGTIVFQKINTLNDVDYNDVFNNCEIPSTVIDCDEWLDGLWNN